MLFARSVQRLVLANSIKPRVCTSVRWASLSTTSPIQPLVFPLHSQVKTTVRDKVAEHLATCRPFSAPPAPALQQPIRSPLVEEGMQLTSTLRKRRLKMNKHKHKKLRKRTRALRKRLGK
ncbi:uncharacterized protein BX664DRAFT_329474 [Halteromyces radiatus]|uniref:uncharacterized protein n=1 Tax=Halteromyces radiatus TaxID=101107 RepID=UPI00222030E9|nr:uncharacterized protein BX664DRAFT_329474 [Halteromyces radiatus]KAI8093340.1 hypothetical protein BX664DRAFT_329474 [Halteromyces radiatus]